MTRLLVPLGALRAADASWAGGKAATLGELRHAGFAVPDGFVVPLDALAATPAATDAAWTRAALGLGPRVAVRSSGLAEDGGQRSFAGQHDTWLDVAPGDVPAAIRAVAASGSSARARAYRRGEAGAGVAVLVQRQVAAAVAGVLFTVNPATGSWSEMVLEAVAGPGEGLVSGRVAPHAWVVRRPRRLRGVAPLRVVDENLHDHPGTTLLRDEVTRLCRLGLRIEKRLGRPVDVEWVRDAAGEVFVVQARPITTTGVRREAEVLWTRRFVGERWSEPATPLGWSVLEPILASFVSYPETERRFLGGGPPFRLVHGWPYVNVTVFRHLAFKLPGSPPPAFMLELLPPEEERAFRRSFAVAPDLRVYRSILATTWAERRWERFRWNPVTNPIAWERFEADLDAFLRAPGDLDAHLSRIREYVGIHLCSLLFANLAWQLLDGALARSLPERRDALRDALAVCPPGNRTVETNRALHALARAVTEEELDALRAQRVPPRFEGFLGAFGHRSTSSWELMAPRWVDQPALLVPLLLAQRGATLDPEALELRQEARFAEALAEVRRTLSGPALTVVELLVRYARRYLLLRENQRWWFDRLLHATQKVLLARGAELVRSGRLGRTEDVAFLRADELAEGVGPGVVDTRRAAWEADRRVAPPVFLRGDDPGPPPEAGPRMRGLGISPGRRRGRVRVLRELADGARLAPGEVLVARAVDPAWTPLFLSASAVVLELGSLLSHGAVVAREYGVPAVVNVEDATARLRDGQEVTVDGTRGLVLVHP